MALINSDGSFSPAFDELVQRTLDRWNIPGFSVAVVSNDKITSKGYGHSRLPDQKVTADTLFNVASTTKAFTASTVSFLVDDDENHPEIKWTTPVSTLLKDDFVLADEYATANVTIEDILSHRTGIATHDMSVYGQSAAKPDTVKSLTRNLRNIPFDEALRTEFLYSNTMFGVACHLVETINGKPFVDILRQRIWEPLGMSNTCLGIDDAKEHSKDHLVAHGYIWNEEMKKYEDVPWLDQPEGNGAGEMLSSANDFALWIQAMINKSPPLSESAHKELVKPRTLVLDDEDEVTKPFRGLQGYALGWEVDSYHGHKFIGHDGGVNGFSSTMMFFPTQKWGLVAFANADSGSYYAIERIRWALVDELLNVKAEDRFDWDAYYEKQDKKWNSQEVETVYPDFKEPLVPRTRELSEYAGLYWNAGYHDIEVCLKDGALSVDLTDRTWRVMSTLEHMSGEYFIGRQVNVDTKEKWPIKVEFRTGESGHVKAIGMNLESDMDDELVWFDRQDS